MCTEATEMGRMTPFFSGHPLPSELFETFSRAFCSGRSRSFTSRYELDIVPHIMMPGTQNRFVFQLSSGCAIVNARTSLAWQCNLQATSTHIICHIVTHHSSLDATRRTLRAGADTSPLWTLNLDSAHDSSALVHAGCPASCVSESF